jgi:hypothetical protein
MMQAMRKPTAAPKTPALVRRALFTSGAAALAVGFGLNGPACGGTEIETPNPPQPLPCDPCPPIPPPLPPPLPPAPPLPIDASVDADSATGEDADASEDFADADASFGEDGELGDVRTEDVVPLPPPPLPPPAPLPVPPKAPR